MIPNKDMDELIEANIGLVRGVINKKFSYLSGDDEAYQCGLIGLWRALQIYDPERGALSSLAYKCISYEILGLIRHRNVGIKTISLQSTVASDSDKDPSTGCETTLEDTIPSFIDYYSDYVDCEDTERALRKRLTERQNATLTALLRGETQSSVAKVYGVSKAAISRDVSKIREQYRKEFKDT